MPSKKKYEEAEKAFLITRDMEMKAGNFGDLYMHALDWLIVIAFWQTDYYKELNYSLQNLDNLQKNPQYYALDRQENCYSHLARVYNRIGRFAKAEPCARQALALIPRTKGDYKYDLALLVECLLEQRKTDEALKIVQNTTRTAPPNAVQQIAIQQLLGKIYHKKGDIHAAERHLLSSVDAYERMDPEHKKQEYLVNTYSALGKFYISTHQFKKGEAFLAELDRPGLHLTTANRWALSAMRSKIDSASGDYFTALRSFQRQKQLSDSMLNLANIEQINRLEIGFQIKQKQQRIDLLDARNRTSEAQVQKANKQRDLTFVGIAALVVILGLSFYILRLKIKSNRLLTGKQLEINDRNTSLQSVLREKESLLDEKDLLLDEKDLLLKEVHHRVKNNLQIVMSILASQSSLLHTKSAAEVMEESQHRVQAISLIHQKLYMKDGGSSIEMRSYIAELATELADSFDASERKIRFELMVEPIMLDIDQAVPVGLILNETITNAIKHAFDPRGGVLKISLRRTGIDRIGLLIADDGRGLPEGLDFAQARSLGMKMMKGLSGQLHGSLTVTNKNGLTISVEFPLQKNDFDRRKNGASDTRPEVIT